MAVPTPCTAGPFGVLTMKPVSCFGRAGRSHNRFNQRLSVILNSLPPLMSDSKSTLKCILPCQYFETQWLVSPMCRWMWDQRIYASVSSVFLWMKPLLGQTVSVRVQIFSGLPLLERVVLTNCFLIKPSSREPHNTVHVIVVQISNEQK